MKPRSLSHKAESEPSTLNTLNVKQYTENAALPGSEVGRLADIGTNIDNSFSPLTSAHV